MESKILDLCKQRKRAWDAMTPASDPVLAERFRKLTTALTRALLKHGKPVPLGDGDCVRLNAEGNGPCFMRQSLWGRHAVGRKQYQCAMMSLDLADALRRGRAS